jgi:hypothetical protein
MLSEDQPDWVAEVIVGLAVLVLLLATHVVGAWGRGRDRA